MTPPDLVDEVLARSPRTVPAAVRWSASAGGILLVSGLVIGFFTGDAGAGFTALLVSLVILAGLGVFGGVSSAMFQLTSSRWGRAYRRIAEASVVFLPLALFPLVALLIAGKAWIPWLHVEKLTAGRTIWLVRGFWDFRVLAEILGVDALVLFFLFWSFRRDFCIGAVSRGYRGALAGLVGRDIHDPAAESERCERAMSRLAPIVVIAFALGFSLLAIDLLMSLDPAWSSTLFGAWYFIGVVFSGLALLAIVSLRLKKTLGLSAFLDATRQQDIATLLFAFTLLYADFFWCQYLTIWYGHLPEESVYVLLRTADRNLPWYPFAWPTLASFFLLPFVFLLFRRVKASGVLLACVSLLVLLGVFSSRFVEVAPALTSPVAGTGVLGALRPLASTTLVLAGFFGIGGWLFRALLTELPIFPVGDGLFRESITDGRGGHD
jgi:hypothetical protein